MKPLALLIALALCGCDDSKTLRDIEFNTRKTAMEIDDLLQALPTVTPSPNPTPCPDNCACPEHPRGVAFCSKNTNLVPDRTVCFGCEWADTPTPNPTPEAKEG